MKTPIPGVMVAIAGSAPSARAAGDAPQARTERVELGAEVGLLPTVRSAAGGQSGGAMNVWMGFDRVWLRAVGSSIAFPPGLAPAGFDSRQLTVAAGIADDFFLPGLSGPWIGTGLGYWWNTVGSPAGPATASWSS